MSDDAVLTAADAAEQLECDVTTVEELFRTGELPATKFGRSWVTTYAALLDAVRSRCVAEAEQRKAKLKREQTAEIMREVSERLGRQRKAPPEIPA